VKKPEHKLRYNTDLSVSKSNALKLNSVEVMLSSYSLHIHNSQICIVRLFVSYGMATVNKQQ
jgi:hypothetical protein